MGGCGACAGAGGVSSQVAGAGASAASGTTPCWSTSRLERTSTQRAHEIRSAARRGWVTTQQPRPRTVLGQEAQRVGEALAAHLAEHLGVRREERDGEAVGVARREAHVGALEVEAEHRLRVGVRRADVRLARPRRHGDRVPVELRQVVRPAAVDVPLRTHTTKLSAASLFCSHIVTNRFT